MAKNPILLRRRNDMYSGEVDYCLANVDTHNMYVQYGGTSYLGCSKERLSSFVSEHSSVVE